MPDDPGSWDRGRGRYRENDPDAHDRNASFGFGPDESPMGPFGRAPGRQDYTGRGPKDYRRSDDRIREEICDRFTDDWGLDATEITVKVEGADVMLTGVVSDREQKRRAEDIAERASGVRDVINQIRVSRGETTTGTGRAGRGSVAADKDRDR
jgi:BON domain